FFEQGVRQRAVDGFGQCLYPEQSDIDGGLPALDFTASQVGVKTDDDACQQNRDGQVKAAITAVHNGARCSTRAFTGRLSGVGWCWRRFFAGTSVRYIKRFAKHGTRQLSCSVALGV